MIFALHGTTTCPPLLQYNWGEHIYLLAVTLEDGDDLLEILVEDCGILVRAAGQDLGRVLREYIHRKDS